MASDGSAKTIPRPVYKQMMSEFAQQYSDLPEDEKSEYSNIALKNTLAGENDMGSAAPDAGAYEKINGAKALNWHWQLGGSGLPFSIDNIKKVVCGRYHLDPATDTEDLPGVSSISEEMRKEFIDSTIVGDEGNPGFLFLSVYMSICMYCKLIIVKGAMNNQNGT